MRFWQTAIAAAFFLISAAAKAASPLVLMTDFGVKDGAVSEVKGVAYGVSPSLLISDLTHEIPASAPTAARSWSRRKPSIITSCLTMG